MYFRDKMHIEFHLSFPISLFEDFNIQHFSNRKLKSNSISMEFYCNRINTHRFKIHLHCIHIVVSDSIRNTWAENLTIPRELKSKWTSSHTSTHFKYWRVPHWAQLPVQNGATVWLRMFKLKMWCQVRSESNTIQFYSISFICKKSNWCQLLIRRKFVTSVVSEIKFSWYDTIRCSSFRFWSHFMSM